MFVSERPLEDRDRIDIGVLPARDAVVALAPLSPEQADAIAGVFASLDPWRSYGVPEQALCHYFSKDEPGAPRYALMAGSCHVGVVGIRLNWLRGPYLQFLGVVPEFQNVGLGRLVLAWFEEEGRRACSQNVWVMVSQINTRAISFYERHGFLHTAVLRDIVIDGRNEILMRKKLMAS